jgi:CRISPR-associated protein Csd1
MDKQKEDYMTELELTNRDPAYLCGRLLAELGEIQRLAIGGKSTIIDRYYGTASSAPGTVFGTLLRGAQAHLAKLRKNRRGAYEALEKRIEGITAHLPEFPKTLPLKQQALFSLGYYHQRAHDRAERVKHIELQEPLEPEGGEIETSEEA